MGKAELRELADDIKAHGLRDPAKIFVDPETKIESLLDGRNRLDALESLGRNIFNDASFLDYAAPADPLSYVISKNIHRRHLTADQKRDLLAKLIVANPEKSNRQIAAETKQSHVTVGAARKKLESTGQIDQLKKTKGKDGKSRPTRVKVSTVLVRKAARLKIDVRPVPQPKSNPLAEFKYAVDHWFPLMTKTQHEEAIKYASEWPERGLARIANGELP